MLCPRRIDNEIRFGDPCEHARVRLKRNGSLLQQFDDVLRFRGSETAQVFAGEWTFYEIDILDMVAPVGIDDIRFGCENVVIGIYRHEMSVLSVCNVFDESFRQIEEYTVVRNCRVEVASHIQKTAGKNKVSYGAVGEGKGLSAFQFLSESPQFTRERLRGCRLDPRDHREQACLKFRSRALPFINDAKRIESLFFSEADRKAKVQYLDEFRPAGSKFSGHPRCILTEVGGAEAIAQETAHFSGRSAVVVTVDRERQCNLRMIDQLLRKNSRAASS